MASTAQVKQSVRLDGWRHVFEKTNRILTGKPVTVRIADTDQTNGLETVPAWSDGEAITFNGPFVTQTLAGKDPVDAVLALKGLNYHELSHVLFTPRLADELPRMVKQRVDADGDPRFWYAFNALEDQRIETWFTSIYGPSRRYFEATVMNWIITHGTTEAAALVYGRKYLSSRIRVGAETVFVQKHGQQLMDDIKKVVDEYLLILLPSQSAKGMTLVAEFKRLLDQMIPPNAPLPVLPVPDNGCHVHQSPGSGDPTIIKVGRLTKQEQKAAQEAAAEASAEAAAADQAAKEAAAGEGQGQGQGESLGSGLGQGQGEGQGASATPTKGATGSSESKSEGSGGNSAGTGAVDVTTAPVESIRDLVDAAHDERESIKQDASVQKDIDRTLDAVKAVQNNGKIEATGNEVGKTNNVFDPSPEAVMSVRRLVAVLRRIKSDLEPELLRQQRSGRLNIRRAISRKPTDVEIFDTWVAGGEDEGGVEAVLLLDSSGSMSYSMPEAVSALWALKRSFDKMGYRTTALVYNYNHSVLFQPSTSAKSKVPNVRADGGTDPTSAYRDAQRILTKSSQPNKVLVNITDGSWAGNESERLGIIKSLHAMDVHTMILGLDNSVEYNGKHGHKIGYDIKQPMDVVKAVTQLVEGILREVSRRA